MPQAQQGLSSTEAARRLTAEGPNELPGRGPRSLVTIAFSVITEPMFLLLLAAAAIYLVLGSVREALALLASVIVIIITTVIQERRTEQTLARLRDLTGPRALVFMEFVIDPACSFVFEADSETRDVMTRKPRAPNARMFSLRSSVTLGLIAFAFATAVYRIALSNLHEAQARALAFGALVLGNIALMLLSRAQTEPLSRILRRRNPAFWGIVAASLLALGIVIYAPAAASLFRFAVPPLGSMVALIATVMIAMVASELVSPKRRASASGKHVPERQPVH